MKIKVLLSTVASLLISNAALADATLQVDAPYLIQMLDGKKAGGSPFSSESILTFPAGKHQLVVSFEGNYSTREDIRIVTAEPLVINFEAEDDQQLYLDYQRPTNEKAAQKFVLEQPAYLKDRVSGEVVETERFIMPKVPGVQIGRNYQQELITMGKAFNSPATAQPVAQTVAATTATAAVANTASVVAPTTTAATAQKAAPATVQDPLAQMKYWYQQADSESRKAFQIWVIQQQQ